MKKHTPTINPKKGFGELNFGDNIETVVDFLGESEEIDDFADEDDFDTTILYYWRLGIVAIFEGKEKTVLSCVETEIPEATLFGVKVFDLPESEIVALMAENEHQLAETEVEESGERRLSFDDAFIDFYFLDDELITVNWGVLVNESGEIEEV